MLSVVDTLILHIRSGCDCESSKLKFPVLSTLHSPVSSVSLQSYCFLFTLSLILTQLPPPPCPQFAHFAIWLWLWLCATLITVIIMCDITTIFSTPHTGYPHHHHHQVKRNQVFTFILNLKSFDKYCLQRNVCCNVC